MSTPKQSSNKFLKFKQDFLRIRFASKELNEKQHCSQCPAVNAAHVWVLNVNHAGFYWHHDLGMIKSSLVCHPGLPLSQPRLLKLWLDSSMSSPKDVWLRHCKVPALRRLAVMESDSRGQSVPKHQNHQKSERAKEQSSLSQRKKT